MPAILPKDIVTHIDNAMHAFVLEKAKSLLPPPPEPLLASLLAAEETWRAYCDWYHRVARTNIWRVARFAKLASAGEFTKQGGTLCSVFGRKKVPELRLRPHSRAWGWAPTVVRNPDALAEALTDAECRRLTEYLKSADVWADIKAQLASQP